MTVDPEGPSIEVQNAGVVIASPFLPALFQRLQLTEPQADRVGWCSEEAADRAVNLLQYLCTGQNPADLKPLALNNILCGFSPQRPLTPIQATAREIETIKELLLSLLAQWKIVSDTSVGGIRESFFQRTGQLKQQQDIWTLHVQKAPYDALVEQVPWSFTPTDLPWMTSPLTVIW